MDLDWDHVKAVDILAVLRSFAPKSGEVLRVTVYPSDYGLERMAEEAAVGPKIFQRGKEGKLKGSKAQRKDGDGNDDDDEEEETKASDAEKKRLAMYEKSKLR